MIELAEFECASPVCSEQLSNSLQQDKLIN